MNSARRARATVLAVAIVASLQCACEPYDPTRTVVLSELAPNATLEVAVLGPPEPDSVVLDLRTYADTLSLNHLAGDECWRANLRATANGHPLELRREAGAVYNPGATPGSAGVRRCVGAQWKASALDSPFLTEDPVHFVVEDDSARLEIVARGLFITPSVGVVSNPVVAGGTVEISVVPGRGTLTQSYAVGLWCTPSGGVGYTESDPEVSWIGDVVSIPVPLDVVGMDCFFQARPRLGSGAFGIPIDACIGLDDCRGRRAGCNYGYAGCDMAPVYPAYVDNGYDATPRSSSFPVVAP